MKRKDDGVGGEEIVSTKWYRNSTFQVGFQTRLQVPEIFKIFRNSKFKPL